MVNKVKNPLTNRFTKEGGALHKKLIKQGHFKTTAVVKPLSLINNILIEANPTDLLSLYLTDVNIRKILNSKKLLNIINKKYNIKDDNFITFFKKFNLKNINSNKYKTLYLYNLEN